MLGWGLSLLFGIQALTAFSMAVLSFFGADIPVPAPEYLYATSCAAWAALWFLLEKD